MRRSVAILLTFLLMTAGCGGQRRGTSPEQARAIAEIDRRASNIGFDEQRPERLVIVMFPAGEVRDADLKPLELLPELKRLGLSDTQITDVGLQHLKGLTALEELDLSGTPITDTGLLHLKGLAALRELNLTRTSVTAGGVKDLQSALPGAKVLR